MYLPKPGVELTLKKGGFHRCSHGRRFWRQSPRRHKLTLAEVGVRESEEWGQTLKRCLYVFVLKVVLSEFNTTQKLLFFLGGSVRFDGRMFGTREVR